MLQKFFLLNLLLILTVYETTQAKNSKGICNVTVLTNSLVGPQSGFNSQSKGLYTTLQVCCEGWKRVPDEYHRLKCQPICSGDCENGNCVAPNTCECKPGYIKNYLQKCVPTCPVGCSGGTCYKDGLCICHEGYTPSDNFLYCIPECPEGCGPGGTCIAPGSCKCRLGYVLNLETKKCQHYCKSGCGTGGHCIGTNKCKCNPGYKLIKNKCHPSCPKGCQNGICAAPNHCTCTDGRILNKAGNACEFQCSTPCVNADCTGANVCTCRNGYIPDVRVKNKCILKTDAVIAGIENMLNNKGK